MEFELFDKIYTTILKHSEQKDKISDFIEENLCTDSYVIFNYSSYVCWNLGIYYRRNQSV